MVGDRVRARISLILTLTLTLILTLTLTIILTPTLTLTLTLAGGQVGRGVEGVGEGGGVESARRGMQRAHLLRAAARVALSVGLKVYGGGEGEGKGEGSAGARAVVA